MELPKLTNKQRKQVKEMLKALKTKDSEAWYKVGCNGLCSLHFVLYTDDHPEERQEFFSVLKKYYHWLYPGRGYVNTNIYWFLPKESEPRINFLEAVLQKDSEMKEKITVGSLLSGLFKWLK